MNARHLVVAILCVAAGFTGAAHAEEFSGKLAWHRKAVLSTPISGVVLKILVRPGDHVQKGDALIQLDDRFIKINTEQAQAQVERTQRLLDEAQRELDRNIELFERTVLSDHDRQMAHIRYAQAQAEHKAAQANLVKAQMQLEYSTLKAPFDGIVIRKHVEEGETIVNEQSAKPMLELGERGVMAVNLWVGGASLKQLKPGGKAKISVGGKQFDARVQFVSAEPNSKQEYEVSVVFATEGNHYPVGQSARVIVP